MKFARTAWDCAETVSARRGSCCAGPGRYGKQENGRSPDDNDSAAGFPGSVQRKCLVAGQYRPQRRQAGAQFGVWAMVTSARSDASSTSPTAAEWDKD